MQTASQNETICFLGSSRAFGDCADCMEMVSTHISVVLLIGARALKLKRPVKLPYVDLSTPELRLAMSEHELMLNRRTAPDLYRAVHRITREPKPEEVYDEHTLLGAGYEIRPKETPAETIRRLEEAEDRLDTYLQHEAWYGGER